MRFYWELRFRPFLFICTFLELLVVPARMSIFESCICVVTVGADFKNPYKSKFLKMIYTFLTLG